MTSAPPWEIVEAAFVAGAASPGQLPPTLMGEVAFAGRSNVGKSSLLNALLGRKRLVRTSSTPGCTRQINIFEAKARDEATFSLADLPGYGYAKRSKTERAQWAGLIEGYLRDRETLKGLVVLVDVRRGVEEEEQALLDFMAAERREPVAILLVATKVDKVPKSKRKATLARLRTPKGARVMGVSAVTGEGIEQLWRRLRKATGVAPLPAT